MLGLTYFYSDLEPTAEMGANRGDTNDICFSTDYWRYVNGVPTIWDLSTMNYDEESDCYFIYRDNNRNSYAVNFLGGSATWRVVPSTYNGLPVTTICALNGAGAARIIISTDITEIMDYANFGKWDYAYYLGTPEQWNMIIIGENAASRPCYYSATQPTDSENNYWHYDTDGITPVLWS